MIMSNDNIGRIAEWKKDRYGRYISASEYYAEIAGLESPHSIVGSIAAVLGLSPKTVESHILELRKKLGASHKSELSVISTESGLAYSLLDIQNRLVPLSETE